MCVIYNECLSFITQSHIQQATTPPLSSPPECLCGRQTNRPKYLIVKLETPEVGRARRWGQSFRFLSHAMVAPSDEASVGKSAQRKINLRVKM